MAKCEDFILGDFRLNHPCTVQSDHQNIYMTDFVVMLLNQRNRQEAIVKCFSRDLHHGSQPVRS